MKSGGGAKYLRISGPAQPFIPLGTIGRNVQKVGFQPPKGIGEQTVDFFISGSDKSRPIHFRIDCPSLKAGGLHAIQSADLHIAEAEECEARADLSQNPIGNIGEFRFRMAIVFVIEISVLQNLSEFQRHGGSLGEGSGADHMPGKILAKIQHRFSGRRMNNFLHGNRLHVVQWA